MGKSRAKRWSSVQANDAFLATPVENESDVPLASGVTRERPKVILPDNVRKLLQRRARFGGFKGGLVVPQ